MQMPWMMYVQFLTVLTLGELGNGPNMAKTHQSHRVGESVNPSSPICAFPHRLPCLPISPGEPARSGDGTGIWEIYSGYLAGLALANGLVRAPPLELCKRSTTGLTLKVLRIRKSQETQRAQKHITHHISHYARIPYHSMWCCFFFQRYLSFCSAPSKGQTKEASRLENAVPAFSGSHVSEP